MSLFNKPHTIDYDATTPGVQSTSQAAVYRKCGCPHGRSCVCGANPDLPERSDVVCGKCESCKRNAASLRRTGREGKRKCLFPPIRIKRQVTVKIGSRRVTLHREQIDFFKEKAQSTELMAELSTISSGGSSGSGSIKRATTAQLGIGSSLEDISELSATFENGLLENECQIIPQDESNKGDTQRKGDEEENEQAEEKQICYENVGHVNENGICEVEMTQNNITFEQLRMMRVAREIRCAELLNIVETKTKQLIVMEKELEELSYKIVHVGVEMKQYVDTLIAHGTWQRLPIEVAMKHMETKIAAMREEIDAAETEHTEIISSARDVAARKIQRCGRRYLIRAMAERAEEYRIARMRAHASAEIQRMIRGKWGREHAKVVRSRLENTSALLIQRIVRGGMGRIRAAHQRVWKEQERYHKAARVIQARVRLIQNRGQREIFAQEERVREVVRNLNGQAVNIQRVLRGYWARKKRRARRVELSLGPRVRELCDRYIAKGDLFRFLEEVNRDYELHMAQQAELRRMELENATTFIQEVLAHREREVADKWAMWEAQKAEMPHPERAARRYDPDVIMPRGLQINGVVQQGSTTSKMTKLPGVKRVRDKRSRMGASLSGSIGTEERAARLAGNPFGQNKFDIALQEKQAELERFLGQQRQEQSHKGGTRRVKQQQQRRRQYPRNMYDPVNRKSKTLGSKETYVSNNRVKRGELSMDESEDMLRTKPAPDMVIVPTTEVIAHDPVRNRERNAGKLAKGMSALDIMQERSPPQLPLPMAGAERSRCTGGSALLRMEVPSMEEPVNHLLFHAALRSHIKGGIANTRVHSANISHAELDAALEKFVLVAPIELKMTVEAEALEIAAVHAASLNIKGVCTCAELKAVATRLEHDFEFPHDLAASVRTILGTLSGSLENVRPSSVQEKWRKAVAGESPEAVSQTEQTTCQDQGHLAKPSTANPRIGSDSSNGNSSSEDALGFRESVSQGGTPGASSVAQALQQRIRPATESLEKRPKIKPEFANQFPIAEEDPGAPASMALINHFPMRESQQPRFEQSTFSAAPRPITTDTVCYGENDDASSRVGTAASGLRVPGYSDSIEFDRIGLSSSASMRHLPSRGGLLSQSASRGTKGAITPGFESLESTFSRFDLASRGNEMRQLPTRGNEQRGSLDSRSSEIEGRSGRSDARSDKKGEVGQRTGRSRLSASQQGESQQIGMTLVQWFDSMKDAAEVHTDSTSGRPCTAGEELYNWNWTGPLALPDRLDGEDSLERPQPTKRPSTVGDGVPPSRSKDFKDVRVDFEPLNGKTHSRKGSRAASITTDNPNEFDNIPGGLSSDEDEDEDEEEEEENCVNENYQDDDDKETVVAGTGSRPSSRESVNFRRPSSRESGSASRPPSRDSYSSTVTLSTVNWNCDVNTPEARLGTAASSSANVPLEADDPEELKATAKAAAEAQIIASLEKRVRDMALDLKLSDPIERLLTHVILVTKPLDGVRFSDFLSSIADLPQEASTTSREMLRERFRRAVVAAEPFAQLLAGAGFRVISSLAACPIESIGVPVDIAKEMRDLFKQLSNPSGPARGATSSQAGSIPTQRNYDPRYARSVFDPSAPGTESNLCLPPIGKRKVKYPSDECPMPKAIAASRREQLVQRVLNRGQVLGQYNVLEPSQEEMKMGLDFSKTYSEHKQANKLGFNTVVGTAEEVQALHNWHPFPKK